MLLGADGEISDEEVKILIQILHRFFTDEPELEIVTDPAVVAARLPEAVALLNADGDATSKNFVLSRLTDIALADGALMDAESAVILDLAHQMGLPSRVAYAVVVGAAQAVGFRSDVKLNRMSEEIRRGLQSGFARGHLPRTAGLPSAPPVAAVEGKA
ncbi:MAG: TerB family tellurite resistance protein [Acidobacteria bacterium]|nr:MAG: TerB family tellurite resistance protein [Acidobacteriota bacterium]